MAILQEIIQKENLSIRTRKRDVVEKRIVLSKILIEKGWKKASVAREFNLHRQCIDHYICQFNNLYLYLQPIYINYKNQLDNGK